MMLNEYFHLSKEITTLFILQEFYGNVNVEFIFQIKDMNNSNDIPIPNTNTP